VAKRTVVAIGTAFALFLTSSLVGVIVLFRAHELKMPVAIIVLTMPALASLLVAIISNLFEGFKPHTKNPFPYNITLPFVHCSLMLVLERLLTTAPSALEKLPPQLAPALVWQGWQVLGICAILEACVISVLALSGWLT
jgi:hypothetical protein